jgi:hypothetical protein
MPLGQYLLGATFCMLHETVHRLLFGSPVAHVGGPWWFLQAWLSLYTIKITNFPNLTNGEFPSTDFPEGNEVISRSCTSFGEANLSSRGDEAITILLSFLPICSAPSITAMKKSPVSPVTWQAAPLSPLASALRISWQILTLRPAWKIFYCPSRTLSPHDPCSRSILDLWILSPLELRPTTGIWPAPHRFVLSWKTLTSLANFIGFRMQQCPGTGILPADAALGCPRIWPSLHMTFHHLVGWMVFSYIQLPVRHLSSVPRAVRLCWRCKFLSILR